MRHLAYLSSALSQPSLLPQENWGDLPPLPVTNCSYTQAVTSVWVSVSNYPLNIKKRVPTPRIPLT